MPQVTVTHTDQSQSGKDRVYFNGKNNWQDAYYVKKGLYMPKVGMVIEADTSSQTFPGKRAPTWFLNEWKEVKGAPAPYPPQGSGNGQSAPVSSPVSPQAGWDIQSGDLSRYASNIVASAITAGLIKEPHQIVGWAAAAYTSGNSLREGLFTRRLPTELSDMPDPSEQHDRDPEFDDKIPF